MPQHHIAPVPSTKALHTLALTAKETKAMEWMMHRALKGVGMGNTEEVITGTGLSPQAAAGVLGSLRRKGLVDMHQYGRYRHYEVNHTGRVLLGYEEAAYYQHQVASNQAAIATCDAARIAADAAEQTD